MRALEILPLALALLVSCNEVRVGETDQRLGTEPAPLATLADRTVVISKPGEEPGESDLWIHPAAGEPRVLAPARGADDMPTALADGTVAFVSTRTTVASLWIVDPKSGEARQLTNRGLAAGRDLAGFIPPPLREMRIEGRTIRYESAPGTWWSVDADTGRAERSEVAP